MSTVLLLLVAIVLIIIFSILYLIIQFEFDENDFNNKLKVLTEYSRRTNALHPLPDTLSYVSEVDQHEYVVRTISTNDLSQIGVETHDDRIETFNFLNQQFEPTPTDQVRVKAHATDPIKYDIRGDDGWMTMDCPADEHFNANTMRCEPVAPCFGRAPGNYGLTERLIDALVLHHRVPKPEPNEHDIHPTMYLRCLEGGSHVVDECPNNHMFVDGVCVLRNDCADRPDDYILPVFPESLNINEYMVCKGGEPTVVSCPFGKNFDRRLMMCVNAEPCAIHGPGYTYITDDIGSTQYYRCTSADSAELVTCINRVFVNDQYQCSGDARCSTFENGTGTRVSNFDDDVIKYDYAVLVCDNFDVVREVDCDNSDLLDDKLFNGKFIVNVNLPRQVYDAASGQCVPFSMNAITVINPIYGIENVPNDLKLEFMSAFVGQTDRVHELLETDRLDGKVEYARDIDELGINFVDGSSLDCYGEYLYDPFEGTRLNLCNENILAQQLTLEKHEYFVPATGTLRSSDADYQSLCARRLDETDNYISLDHFTTRILANILQSDVCGTILHQIHEKYTTITNKYTTITFKYNDSGVKTSNYIERYGSNIQKSNITKLPTNDYLNPLFDPFEYYDIMQPSFNPWTRDEYEHPPDDNLGVGGGSGGGNDEVPPPPSPPPPPPPPSLTLTDKLLDYTCFYSVPTFKLSACDVADEHIRDAIKELRANVKVESGCENAEGLANVINAYAYLGDGVGCLSVFDNNIITVRQFVGKTFLNINTQSNDGVQYNKWVHVSEDGLFMACPDHALRANFTCNLEDNKLYYMEDLQV
uniref:VP91 n=1 Tax=Melanchra picta nucleopolyhedrovirus TaxID=2975247 RepID=A0AA49CJI1_NPVMC|nr:VP91 [Melanchra picta nucleopolyhedrovirus]